MDDSHYIYGRILSTPSENFKLIGLKEFVDNGKKPESYSFVGILKTSASEIEDQEPDRNELVRMRNYAIRNEYSYPSLMHTIKIDRKGKKDRVFDIMVDIRPENVLDFCVKNGVLYVKCVCTGRFL